MCCESSSSELGSQVKMSSVNNVCRLCLSKDSLVWICDKKLDSENNMKDVILITTGVEINENDVISQMICGKCSRISIRMFQFRKASQKHDRYLKKQYKKMFKTSTVEHANPNTGLRVEKEKEVESKMETKEANEPIQKFHQTVRDLLKMYPRLKLPSICLQYNIEPCVMVEKETVENFPKKNMNRGQECVSLSEPENRMTENSTSTAIDPSLISALSNMNAEKNCEIDNYNEELIQKQSTLNLSENEDEHVNEGDSFAEDESDGIEKITIKPKKRSLDDSVTILDADTKNFSSLEPLPKKSPTCQSTKQLYPDQPVPSFLCSICKSVHDNVRELKRHQSKHLRCQFCKSKFKTIGLKKAHIQNLCAIKKTMNCSPSVQLERIELDLRMRTKFPEAFIGFPLISGLQLNPSSTEVILGGKPPGNYKSEDEIPGDKISGKQTPEKDKRVVGCIGECEDTNNDIVETLSDDDISLSTRLEMYKREKARVCEREKEIVCKREKEIVPVANITQRIFNSEISSTNSLILTNYPATSTTPPVMSPTSPVILNDSLMISTTPPVVSTTPPVISAISPVISTTPPVIYTTPPVVSTTPVKWPTSPVILNSSLMMSTTPVISTRPPVISTTSTVISTTPPVISTTPPVISTTPPVISTTPPVILNSSLMVSTSPVISTTRPVISTTPPVISTIPPVISTSPPVITTNPPVISTTPPVMSHTSPVILNSSLMVSTTSPVISTISPVISTTPPVISTSPPVISTAPSVISTTAPVISTDRVLPVISPTSSVTSRASEDSLSSALLKPEMKIRNSNVLDTIDLKLSEMNLFKELLTKNTAFKIRKEESSQTDLPCSKSISLCKNGQPKEFKNLKNLLFSYKIPILSTKGNFRVRYDYKPRNVKPKRKRNKLLWLWNDLTPIDVKVTHGSSNNQGVDRDKFPVITPAVTTPNISSPGLTSTTTTINTFNPSCCSVPNQQTYNSNNAFATPVNSSTGSSNVRVYTPSNFGIVREASGPKYVLVGKNTVEQQSKTNTANSFTASKVRTYPRSVKVSSSVLSNFGVANKVAVDKDPTHVLPGANMAGLQTTPISYPNVNSFRIPNMAVAKTTPVVSQNSINNARNISNSHPIMYNLKNTILLQNKVLTPVPSLPISTASVPKEAGPVFGSIRVKSMWELK